jgi:hypothetical protein
MRPSSSFRTKSPFIITPPKKKEQLSERKLRKISMREMRPGNRKTVDNTRNAESTREGENISRKKKKDKWPIRKKRLRSPREKKRRSF